MSGGTGCLWFHHVLHGADRCPITSPCQTLPACIPAASPNKPVFLNSIHAANRVWCSKTQFKAVWTQTALCADGICQLHTGKSHDPGTQSFCLGLLAVPTHAPVMPSPTVPGSHCCPSLVPCHTYGRIAFFLFLSTDIMILPVLHTHQY